MHALDTAILLHYTIQTNIKCDTAVMEHTDTSTHLGLDDSADGHSLEAQQEPVVHSEPILDLALLFEAKVSAHSAALMIASDQKHFVRVLELERQQVQYDLTAEGTSVNIVSKEQQVVVRAPLLEDVQQVEVLAVDVAYYHHWGVHFYNVLQCVVTVAAAAAVAVVLVAVIAFVLVAADSISDACSSCDSSSSSAADHH
jgi:hypothetical protein